MWVKTLIAWFAPLEDFLFVDLDWITGTLILGLAGNPKGGVP